MTAARWRALADRLLNGPGGSTIQWTRRTLNVDGPAGTVTQTAATTYPVRVAQLAEEQRRLLGSQSWQTASVRLIASASSLPFGPETASGVPEIRFEDSVDWLGTTMRVVSFDVWAAPGGPGLPPQRLAYLVGLGA